MRFIKYNYYYILPHIMAILNMGIVYLFRLSSCVPPAAGEKKAKTKNVIQ